MAAMILGKGGLWLVMSSVAIAGIGAESGRLTGGYPDVGDSAARLPQFDDSSNLQHSSLSAWTFDDPKSMFASKFGAGRIEARGDIQGLRIGTAAQFGIPALGSADDGVLQIPALRRDQALQLTHAARANGFFGAHGRVSRYTIIWDVLWPRESHRKWRALYQTDRDNKDDAELFVRSTPFGELGIGKAYDGRLTPDKWHRIVLVVRSAGREGHFQKFVDGMFIGGQGSTGNPIDERWSLSSDVLLFADNNEQTAPVYMTGLAFIGEALSFEQAVALGRPTARGPNVRGSDAARWPWKSSRDVMIFAHRGDSGCAPENTLTSIEQAFEKGADAVEIDIRLSKERTVVLMHDRTVNRTTNGKGPVSSFTVPELKRLDAGSWFSPEFAGTRIPTLAEALRVVNGRGRAYLDIKQKGMAPAIKAAVAEAQVPLNSLWVWLDSDEEEEIDTYARVMPGVPMLHASTKGWDKPYFFDNLKAKGVEGFSIGFSRYTPDFAKAARNHGLFVEVFTILGPEGMKSATEAGVDGIETDYPGVLRSLLP